ncbi:MAG: hypothetical protein WCF17_22955 [Terracidiphilus sp.]
MCPHRRLDFHSRMILGLGNLCLFTGLTVSLLATDFARHHYAIYNGLRFGLLSLAIALNFWAMRSAGRGNKGQA